MLEKSWLSISIIVISCSFLHAQDAEKLFNRGFHYLKVDNHKAIEYLSESIELDSSQAEAYYFRAIARYKQDDLGGSLDDFRRAKHLDQSLDLIPIYMGFIHRKMDAFDSALYYFDEYITSNPNDTNAYSLVLRGKLKRIAGDLDGSIEDFERALRIDPVEESYHYYKFMALFDDKQYQKALAQIDQAIKLNNQFYGYYFNKGNVYYELKDYNKAIKQYSIAIDLNYENGELYFHRGLAEQAKNNIEAAITDYNTAIAYNSEDGTYYFHRGHAKMSQGKKFEACNDWYKAGSLGFYENFEKVKEVCEQEETFDN